jgi:hypothetical protein
MKTARAIVISALLGVAALLGACAGNGERRATEASYGKVFGEFEDASLLAEAFEAVPAMRRWSDRELCEGLSGATIQAKTMGRVPDRIVLEKGRRVAYADGYGQFFVALKPGVHELVGRCKGYRDAKARVELRAGSEKYVIFSLEKK